MKEGLVSARAFRLIAPYAAWMVLMTVLPRTAWAYAVRGAATLVLLMPALWTHRALPARFWTQLAAGLVCGLAVFAIWIAPDLVWPPPSLNEPSPYAPSVCGWPLTLAKIAASAFVISIAEELFFRRWLVEFAGFWWMVVLFAVEHGDRWHVGAVTGVLYGLLAKRLGLFAAIVAHAVTNLVLGLYVVLGDKWFYW